MATIVSMTALMNELKAIQTECNGADASKPEEKKRNADSFLALKEDLHVLLDTLDRNVDEKNAIVEQHGSNNRSIKLGQQNRKDLETAKKMWNELHQMNLKASEKGKMDSEELSQRTVALEILKKQIYEIELKHARQKAPEANDLARRELALRRAQAAAADKAKGGKGSSTVDEPQPLAPEEDMYMSQTQAHIDVQDVKLDSILKGVKTIHNIADAQAQEMQVQDKILDATESKIDRVTAQLKTTNKSLQELLEKTGGAAKWCPIIILIVIFIALIGYIYNIAIK